MHLNQLLGLLWVGQARWWGGGLGIGGEYSFALNLLIIIQSRVLTESLRDWAPADPLTLFLLIPQGTQAPPHIQTALVASILVKDTQVAATDKTPRFLWLGLNVDFYLTFSWSMW